MHATLYIILLVSRLVSWLAGMRLGSRHIYGLVYNVIFIKSFFFIQKLECDEKFKPSFTYKSSYPLIVTSNYTLDHIGQSPVDAQALRNRSREIFVYAKMVDTIEELNECHARGEPAVKKPHFNILPEILCGLFVKHFDDKPVPRLMENHEIQTPPPHLVQRFRQNELESQTKKIK